MNLLLPLCLRVGCGRKGLLFSELRLFNVLMQTKHQLFFSIAHIYTYSALFMLLTDAPKMRQADISFALTVVLHAMNPPLAKIAPQHGPQGKTMAGSDPRSQSWSHQQLDPRAYPKVKPSILRISFLGESSLERHQVPLFL